MLIANFLACLCRIAAVILVLVSPGLVMAGSLPVPSGRVIVTVSGKIANTNQDGVARIDRAILESAGLETLKTSTPHTEGVEEFTGIRLSALRNLVGSSGGGVKVRALDGYRVEIGPDVIDRYDPLMALDRNGKPMRVREKGPAWIVFPWDRYPELDSVEFASLSIWQIAEIEFE